MIAAVAAITFAVLGSVVSTPLPGSKSITIPLRQRDTRLAINGVVNTSALASEMARIQAYVPVPKVESRSL
jgi:hypothetical protein